MAKLFMCMLRTHGRQVDKVSYGHLRFMGWMPAGQMEAWPAGIHGVLKYTCTIDLFVKSGVGESELLAAVLTNAAKVTMPCNRRYGIYAGHPACFA